jgi:hypothetical protein
MVASAHYRNHAMSFTNEQLAEADALVAKFAVGPVGADYSISQQELAAIIHDVRERMRETLLQHRFDIDNRIADALAPARH